MKIELLLENCKCGESLVARRVSWNWGNVKKTTSSLCLKRKWYNFWKHDKEILLTLGHPEIIW